MEQIGDSLLATRLKQTKLLSYLFLTPTDKPIAYSYIFWEELFKN